MNTSWNPSTYRLPDADMYLYMAREINEDSRLQGSAIATGQAETGPRGYTGAYDWRVWSAMGYGKQLQGMLYKGSGYASEVTDFGQWVVVRSSYHNPATGRSVSKTFVIVFKQPNKGDGDVFASSTRWRSISSVSQAASYINSYINSASNSTR